MRECAIWEFPRIRGTLFWSPYNEDPTTQGTKRGSPIFANSHMGLTSILCLAEHLLEAFHGFSLSAAMTISILTVVVVVIIRQFV